METTGSAAHGVSARGRTSASLRVTHVVFDLDGGGLETVIANLARGFAHTDVRTSVLSLSGRPGRVGSAISTVLEELRVVRPRRGVSMIAPLGVAQSIRDMRTDVVHLHSGAWYKGALAARLAGVRRVIYTEHGREHHDPLLLRLLDRTAARMTTTVVPVSRRLERYLHARLGIPWKRLRTIENAVDLERFSPGPAPADLRARLQLPAEAQVLGSVGRLEEVKGYDRLLRVFADLRGRAPDRPLYLVIAGEGSARPGLEAAARELGVEPWVRLPGWLDSPVDFYRLLDVFVLTSRSEGLSVSLLEAIACGVVPVVNAVGANEDILGEDLASQLVGAEDWSAFTAVVESSLGSAELRAQLATAARRRAVERYGLERLLAEYEEVYRG